VRPVLGIARFGEPTYDVYRLPVGRHGGDGGMSSVVERPRGAGTPSLLYVVQSFQNQAQIVRLAATLARVDPRGRVLVCHNAASFSLDPDLFREEPRIQVLNVSGVRRAGMSLPMMYLRSLDHVDTLGWNYDWVVNMTGQCYPCRPLSELKAMLATTAADAFVDHWEIFGPGCMWPRQEAALRYAYRYRWRLLEHEPHPLVRKLLGLPRLLINRAQPWIRVDTSYTVALGVRDRSGIFGDHYPLYGGSYYMTLSRAAAQRLREVAAARPELLQRCAEMIAPSEAFPHTVLLNSADLTVSPEHHFFLDVAGARVGRHPVLTATDADRIVASGRFFARKVDLGVDRALLDRLDEVSGAVG
jgi:hypothetical protein